MMNSPSRSISSTEFVCGGGCRGARRRRCCDRVQVVHRNGDGTEPRQGVDSVVVEVCQVVVEVCQVVVEVCQVVVEVCQPRWIGVVEIHREGNRQGQNLTPVDAIAAIKTDAENLRPA